MRTLEIDGRNIDHIHGPYLVFARSHPAFSDHHGFEDWSFFGGDYAGKMWGKNAVVAYINRPSEFNGAGAIPDWIEFLEVASISTDHGYPPHSSPAVRVEVGDVEGHMDDGTDLVEWCIPSARNLLGRIDPGPTPDKRFFDRRLLVVSYGSDDTDRHIARHNSLIRRALGVSSATVWHSEDIFAFAFRDSGHPQGIVDRLAGVLGENQIFDCAAFKLAAVMPEKGVPSPLAHFLEQRGRSAAPHRPVP